MGKFLVSISCALLFSGVTAIADARPSNAPNLRVCPKGETPKGVDLADGQTSINWNTLRADGLRFTIIKATEGITYVDPFFRPDWENAKKVGMIRGAYHYFRPGDDPAEQAQAFLKTIGTLAEDDLAPVLDWEETDGVSNKTQIARAKIWLQLVEQATGKKPLVYTYLSFWNKLGNPQGFDQYPLWMAYPEGDCPVIPPPWSDWAIWQNNVTTPVNGINGSVVDQDVFNGSIEELTASLSAYDPYVMR